jgi:putative sterol carrier protein
MRTGDMLSPAEGVSCWIEGNSETFAEIAVGALNLQKALAKGQITVSGNPLQLLALSKVVDAGLRIKGLPLS